MLEFVVFLFVFLPITISGFIAFYMFWVEIDKKDFMTYLLLGCLFSLMTGTLIFVLSVIFDFIL